MNETLTLARAVGVEPARLDVDASGNAHVVGLMAPFETWVEIDSVAEGNFLERIATGAFTKTIAENGQRIRAIFHHGADSHIGFKVIGPIEALEEDDDGVRYRLRLLDTTYNADLRPGIEAGQYGTSFRGTVVKRDIDRRPKRSAHNPKGLPEVTYTEIRLQEFGLTPFPVYEGTTATMRSLLDDEVRERIAAGVAPAVTRAHTVDVVAGVEISRSRYEHSLRYVSSTPWAITPEALAVIVGIIGERASGYRPSLDEIRERIGTVERAAGDDPSVDGLAVIPVHGPIVGKADLFSEMSGATSITGLQAALRDAVANSDVRTILLDVDSPGGSTELVPELAADIRAAREEKPVVAVANTVAASAAYWIAAQAGTLYVSPSGQVGSIGVYTVHEDLSAKLEADGVSPTIISAGDYKVEGNPFGPLTDEAQAEIQSKVDAFYEMFVDDVAAGRGVTTKQVLADYGQGRMLLARDAKRAGMVDAVATYDSVVAKLAKSGSVKRSNLEPEPSAATTRHRNEPEPIAATTRSPRLTRGKSETPYWRL